MIFGRKQLLAAVGLRTSIASDTEHPYPATWQLASAKQGKDRVWWQGTNHNLIGPNHGSDVLSIGYKQVGRPAHPQWEEIIGRHEYQKTGIVGSHLWHCPAMCVRMNKKVDGHLIWGTEAVTLFFFCQKVMRWVLEMLRCGASSTPMLSWSIHVGMQDSDI